MNGCNLRIGQGIDIHSFKEGRALILGGVKIPSQRGLAGHSDADVLVHALIDAILGAVGQADIGVRFPDTESEWKDISSLELLRLVWEPLRQEGYRIVNLDAALLMEAPKIRPYVKDMQANLAAVLGASPELCSIKATTAEKLGAIGREEGVLAACVVLLERA